MAGLGDVEESSTGLGILLVGEDESLLVGEDELLGSEISTADV